jgi:hypothetical protein
MAEGGKWWKVSGRWIRFSFVVPNNPSVPSLRLNSNHSSSLSAVSSTPTSAHKAADYETKRCAPALGSNLEEKCADVVVFRLVQKMKFNIASEFTSYNDIIVDVVDKRPDAIRPRHGPTEARRH